MSDGPRRVTGGWSVRIRYGGDQRGRFRMPDMPEPEAQERARRLKGLAELLSSTISAAGRHEEARILLQDAAEQRTEKGFATSEAVAREVIANAGIEPTQTEPKTFRDVAELWISGDLHRRFPDRVPAKADVRHDRARAAVLCNTVGDVPLARFTIDTAERALASLPTTLMRSTRRQYAQVLVRVLRLAAFPLRVIEHSPLPDRWLPKEGPRRAFPFLYPDEDELLMRCNDIALGRRLLYGFLAREGLRISEAMRMTWSDLDLARGVIRLDRNKTKRPRAWKLGADVASALQRWRELSQGDIRGAVFRETFSPSRAAEIFRGDLEVARIDRSDLHEQTAERSHVRIHDLRGTFVTLALASGRSESWVMDRTGHTTSAMLNRYRRQARHAAELEMGWFGPLDGLTGVGHARVAKAKNKPEAVGLAGNY
jgi:integrase